MSNENHNVLIVFGCAVSNNKATTTKDSHEPKPNNAVSMAMEFAFTEWYGVYEATGGCTSNTRIEKVAKRMQKKHT